MPPRLTTAQERNAVGLCTKCGRQPQAPNRRMCAPCLKYEREKWHEKATARRAKGLCANCGKQPARPERSECTECAARSAARYDRKKGRERVSKRYWSRVAAGLCAKCGKMDPLPGRRNCAPCREHERNRDRANRQRRRAQGLCTTCGRPSPVFLTCDICRERNRHCVARQAMPVWETRYAVYVLATGECLGTYDSREDVALCLAFAKLDREAVEIVTDAPAIAGLTGWT